MAHVGMKIVVLAGLVAWVGAAGDEGAKHSPGDGVDVRASADEITQLVKDLADSSFPVRERATRRLLAIGLDAREALEKVAKGDDDETTLRAKAILDIFDRLLFSGVEVTLSFSQATMTWDRPVDLLVTLTNRSRWPAKVP